MKSYLFRVFMFMFMTMTFARMLGQQPSDLLVLADELDRYPLGLYLDILEDPTRALTIQQVASPEYAGRFTRGQGENTNFGFTQSAYWARFQVSNQASEGDEWLLVMSDTRMQYIDLYVPAPGGEGFTVRQTGAVRPFATRDFPHNRFVFRLTLPRESEQTIYLRFQSDLAMTFPLTIWSWEAFTTAELPGRFKSGVFYGALIILLGYNLFLFFSLREASYLYYVLFLASMLVGQAAFEGIAGQYLWPRNMGATTTIVLVCVALANLTALMFTNVFLLRLVRLRWLSWLFYGLMAGWGVLIAILLLVENNALATNWMIVFTTIAIVIVGIIAFQRGYRQARFFLLAWPGYFVALSMVRLVRLGLLPTTFLWPDVHFALLWLALFWSLALADRINLLKAQAEESNQELSRSEGRLSQFLDALPIGVTVFGPDRRVQYINQSLRRILGNPERGIQPDASARRTLDEVIDYYSLHDTGTGERYPAEPALFSQVLKGEAVHADDVEADLVDRRVPLEIWANPIFSKLGDLEYTVLALQDITQRKQVEEDLRESRARFAGMLEIAAEAIVSFDETQHISLFNREAETVFGYASEEVIGQPIDILIPEQFGAEHANYFKEFEASPVTARMMAERQYFGCRKNGEVFPIEGSISKLEVHGQKIFTIMLRDVSDRLQTEIELANYSRNLEGLVEARTQELTRANERLENEITIRLEQAQLLATAEERTRLARDLHDSVTQILFSANLLAEVLPEIWQRNLEEGKATLSELHRLTHGALAEMRTFLLELRTEAIIKTPLGELIAQLTEAVTSRRLLPYQLSIGEIPTLPEVVHTTFYRIGQEALNNVVKHSGASQVSVSLKASQLQNPPSEDGWRGQVILSIQDDGKGFQTGDLAEEKMGLSIMRERASAIGADLTIDSLRGAGTQVVLTWEN
jgi:PAS domain S-box-containing protein